MALPVGVTAATCTVGVPVSFTGAANIRANVSVKPSVSLVHAATGTPLVDMMETIDTTDGVAGQFTLPHTDQAGFVDENQNAYANWFYTVTIQYSNDRQVMPPKSKVFQLTTGQTLVDLDLLPSGVPALPYSAPAATLSSFEGRTGAVTLQESDLPDRLSVEELSATYGTAALDMLEQFGRKSAANVDAYTKSKNMPSGTPLIMSETGQASTTFGNGSTFTVTGGVITNTHTAGSNGAAYLQTQIEGNETVRRMFAVVNAPTDNGSSLALVFPAAEWRAGGTGPLGPAGLHYVIDPVGNWHVGYWTGSAEETYTSGTAGTWKDATDHYVEIVVDVAASSCTITHPDGTSTTVTDSRIAPNISGWGIIESYVFSGTAPSFAIKDFGLAAKAPSAAEPFVGKATHLAGIASLKSVAMNNLTDGTYVAPTSTAVVAAGVTEITFNAPASGKAILTVEGFVENTDAAAHYIWGLSVVTGSTTAVTGTGVRRVLVGLYKGTVITRFILTGMDPGKVAILGLRHMSTVASASTLKVAGANAYPFNMSMTPIS